jgi:hypothetical protein
MRTFIILFSVAWVVGFVAFLGWRDFDALWAMGPGEWGELLSGLFGPPGFVAVLGTLIQQGGDLKRQREQIEKQLKTLEVQSAAQVDAAKATKEFAEASLAQSRAAREQADSAAKQTELAIERLQIERMRNRVTALAMMAVRYSDRLTFRPAGATDSISLLGSKEDLSSDLKLGPEAVLETVRQRLTANLQRIRAEKLAFADESIRSRFRELVPRLVQRVDETQQAIGVEAGVQEFEQMKLDLGLAGTRRLLNEVRDVMGLA